MNERIARLEQCLRTYLEKHPSAADSASGIAQWWLASNHFSPTHDELDVAITRLIAAGVMRRITLGGTVLYASAVNDATE